MSATFNKIKEVDKSKLEGNALKAYNALKEETDNFDLDTAVALNLDDDVERLARKIKEKFPQALKEENPIKKVAEKKAKASAKKKPKKKSKKKSKPKSSGGNTGSFAKLRSAIAKREGISYKDALSLAKKEYAEAKEEAAAQGRIKRNKRLEKFKKEYKGKGVGASDLDKDAKISAKPSGKRISKNNKVYYEYRDNRIDVKQPQPSDYPKLAEGGEIIYPTEIIKGIMAKGGKIGKYSFYVALDKFGLVGGFNSEKDAKAYIKHQVELIYEGMPNERKKERAEARKEYTIITREEAINWKGYVVKDIDKQKLIYAKGGETDEFLTQTLDFKYKGKRHKFTFTPEDSDEFIGFNSHGIEFDAHYDEDDNRIVVYEYFKELEDQPYDTIHAQDIKYAKGGITKGQTLAENFNMKDEVQNVEFWKNDVIVKDKQGKVKRIDLDKGERISLNAKGGKLSDKEMKQGASKEYYDYFKGYRPNTTQYILLDDNYAAIVTKYRNSDVDDAYDIYDDKFQFRGSASGIKGGESGKQKLALRKEDFEKSKSFKDLYTKKKMDMSMAMMRAKGGNITHD